MPRILAGLVVGVAMLFPTAATFADEGNWDARVSSTLVVDQSAPTDVGTVVGDGPSVGQFHADQEHADR
ncbi:MAG TPA: hypothetical protein VFP86_02140 [bacterium]|nr:hypothetical protein [bacterium]